MFLAEAVDQLVWSNQVKPAKQAPLEALRERLLPNLHINERGFVSCMFSWVICYQEHDADC